MRPTLSLGPLRCSVCGRRVWPDEAAALTDDYVYCDACEADYRQVMQDYYDSLPPQRPTRGEEVTAEVFDPPLIGPAQPIGTVEWYAWDAVDDHFHDELVYEGQTCEVRLRITQAEIDAWSAALHDALVPF